MDTTQYYGRLCELRAQADSLAHYLDRMCTDRERNSWTRTQYDARLSDARVTRLIAELKEARDAVLDHAGSTLAGLKG